MDFHVTGYCVNYMLLNKTHNGITVVQKCGSAILFCAILLQHLQQTYSQLHEKCLKPKNETNCPAKHYGVI